MGAIFDDYEVLVSEQIVEVMPLALIFPDAGQPCHAALVFAGPSTATIRPCIHIP
jgi:hypothetical protein